MQRLIAYIKISLGQDIKNNLLITLSLILTFGLILIILMNIDIPKGSDNFIPKNMAYIQMDDNISKEKIEQAKELELNYYKTIPLYEDNNKFEVYNPFSSDLYIPLEDMVYVKETSLDMIKNNQKKIDMDYSMEYVNIQYDFNNEVVSNKNINLSSEIYNIDYLINGNYPKTSNEVLIGETTANYYLKKMNLSNYDDLLGKKIRITTECTVSYCTNIPQRYKNIFSLDKNYTISGIYKTNNYNINTTESFIIEPPNEIKDLYLEYYKNISYAYFIEGGNSNDLKYILQQAVNVRTITFKDIKKVNMFKVVLFLLIIVLNVLIYLIYGKTRKQTKFILEYYRYSNIKIYIISLIPFIFFNIILFSLIYVVLKM